MHGKNKLNGLVALLSMALTLAGTGCLDSGGGGGGVSNDDPGNNDVNVYVALGDSLTSGSECNCAPYPSRLGGLLGKTVVNSGSSGEQSADGASRAPGVLARYQPGFLLILHGVNDIIHGHSSESAAANVRSMVVSAKNNKTVPVVATYPIPTDGHAAFAGGVTTLNNLIRDMAGAEDVTVVDLESEFSGAVDLLGPDGLHPNDAGTQVIAMSFFDVLQ